MNGLKPGAFMDFERRARARIPQCALLYKSLIGWQRSTISSEAMKSGQRNIQTDNWRPKRSDLMIDAV